MVCMKKTLPQADVGIFEISPTSGELKFVAFQKEYESGHMRPNFETSYHAPCQGDSGTGHWLTIDKYQATPWNNIKMSQRVLVAVYTTELRGTYTRNGNPLREPGVCGGDVTVDDGSKLVGANYCTKTTNERVFEFLKVKAGICEVDERGNCKVS